jgi:hypothetical protein
MMITQLGYRIKISESEVVEHFAKKQKETKTAAKQEDIKSNKGMTESKNEVTVR